MNPLKVSRLTEHAESVRGIAKYACAGARGCQGSRPADSAHAVGVADAEHTDTAWVSSVVVPLNARNVGVVVGDA
jgi:hypothetical protein